MIRSATSLCRRGFTCLFVNLAERQNLCRYESTTVIHQLRGRIPKSVEEKTKEKEKEEFVIDDTDHTIISQGIFPTKESLDILVDGIPYKEIPVIHIKATSNNTLVCLVDNEKNTLAFSSAGTVGFKNKKKGSNIAAQTTATDIAQKTLFKDIKTVRVCVQGIGAGRLPAIKALEAGGLNIISITDTTKMPFNGNRPPKARKI